MATQHSTGDGWAHHFSVVNIPFGIASSPRFPSPQPATRVDNDVIFLCKLYEQGLLSSVPDLPAGVFKYSTLNAFAALPKTVHSAVREAIQNAWREGSVSSESREDVSSVTMHLPVHVSDFTDFSCSLEHVKNAGRIVVNNANPPPGFFHFPTAYAGRASSVVVSGTPIERPLGHFPDRTVQVEAPAKPPVIFAPTRALDYEVEFAAVIGTPLPMGQRTASVAAVDRHIFGFVLLNDWSARDIQGLEMLPLGPCNGKNLGTSVSPWVVLPDALSPFRTQGPEHLGPVAPHLADPVRGTFDVTFEVAVQPAGAGDFATAGRSSLKDLYWTPRQMVSHIVSAGAPLRTGDLMATGTVSGAGRDKAGCLLEATEGGKVPLELGGGLKRAYLEDGDIVRITAVAGGEGSGVGFGEVVGQNRPLVPHLPDLPQRLAHLVPRRPGRQIRKVGLQCLGVLDGLRCSLSLRRQHGVGRVADEDGAALAPRIERVNVAQLPQSNVLVRHQLDHGQEPVRKSLKRREERLLGPGAIPSLAREGLEQLVVGDEADAAVQLPAPRGTKQDPPLVAQDHGRAGPIEVAHLRWRAVIPDGGLDDRPRQVDAIAAHNPARRPDDRRWAGPICALGGAAQRRVKILPVVHDPIGAEPGPVKGHGVDQLAGGVADHEGLVGQGLAGLQERRQAPAVDYSRGVGLQGDGRPDFAEHAGALQDCDPAAWAAEGDGLLGLAQAFDKATYSSAHDGDFQGDPDCGVMQMMEHDSVCLRTASIHFPSVESMVLHEPFYIGNGRWGPLYAVLYSAVSYDTPFPGCTPRGSKMKTGGVYATPGFKV
ncbi:fumarylacetoacetase [Pyricularia oryzae Y34]|uniref:fumarylacetoacetase n=2 Tax=Pyricularia oryzae TaxID=318829 RepID=A0AA97P2R1_PYRO3|nr:fumarylacetoacetase [Pyricularia oryzae Y34]